MLRLVSSLVLVCAGCARFPVVERGPPPTWPHAVIRTDVEAFSSLNGRRAGIATVRSKRESKLQELTLGPDQNIFYFRPGEYKLQFVCSQLHIELPRLASVQFLANRKYVLYCEEKMPFGLLVQELPN